MQGAPRGEGRCKSFLVLFFKKEPLLLSGEKSLSTINTTLGTTDTANLGRTLIHEHVLVGYPGWFIDNRMPRFVRSEALARVTAAFQQLHAYGVRTVVDPCPSDLGRDVEFVAEISQRSGITLICATGVYTEAQGIPFALAHHELDAICDIFQREIEDGIGATGIKPGLLKIATGDGAISDYERKMLTAAARVAKRTNTPLLSHTENCTCGHDQIDIVTGEGVEPHHLLVGHSCGRDDHDYQAALARRGAYVGFDRFGIEIFNTDASRMKNVKQMIDAGLRDHVMLSHDTVNCWLGGIPGFGSPEIVKDVLPSWKLTHLFENILPQLQQMGVAATDLDHILTENPRRYFEGTEKPAH
jgi:phosphotriesterase-related protein